MFEGPTEVGRRKQALTLCCFDLRPLQIIQMSEVTLNVQRAQIPSLQVLAAAALMGPDDNRNRFQRWLMMKQFGIRLDRMGCFDRLDFCWLKKPELVVELNTIKFHGLIPGREELGELDYTKSFVRIVYQAPVFWTGNVLCFDDGCRNEIFLHIWRDPEEASVACIPVPKLQDVLAGIEACPEEETVLCGDHESDLGMVEARWVPERCWTEPLSDVVWESAKYSGSTPQQLLEEPVKRFKRSPFG